MRRTNQAHREAMHTFFDTDFGPAVHSSGRGSAWSGSLLPRDTESYALVDILDFTVD